MLDEQVPSFGSRIILYSFYALLLLTPVVWAPFNFELFEYNKMIFVYLLTTIITGTWALKSINQKRLTINHTPLDIPILLFLGANILSTFFSIDPHTSIWGYYSRSNGGLLSIICYTLLYFAFTANITRSQSLRALKMGLWGAVIVSLWAIPEHFGASPSCLILRGELTADCWVQDVKARVFATLGQPNWLAAYLGMLIFPCLYFILTATTKAATIRYTLYAILLYLAFTFTYSRSGMLGFLVGLATFLGLYIFCHSERKRGISGFIAISKNLFIPEQVWGFFTSFRMTRVGIILAIFLAINLYFGSALTRFNLSQLHRPTDTPIDRPTGTGTQLESGGTESGQIRLIVWQGAVDIFKAYPILGSGVETFAYAYYQFRPASHNLVSEWDFLYNKAHNEYLNYLANNGIVGFISYLAIIITFIVWSIKYIVYRKDKPQNTTDYILPTTILAGFITNLVQNFFGFSVVATNLLFFLFPAIAFVVNDSVTVINLRPLSKIPIISHLILLRSKIIANTLLALFTSLFIGIGYIFLSLRYNLPTLLALPILSILLYAVTPPRIAQMTWKTKSGKFFVYSYVISTIIFVLYYTTSFWYADTLFALGQRSDQVGNPGRAYNYLTSAVEINKNEPFYRSELGYSAASAALALKETDATLSGQLKDESIQETEYVLATNPKNVSYYRTAIRTYYQLADIDSQYIQKTLDMIDKAITLAPTDPKLYYNKAVILSQNERSEEAIEALKKTIELKPNYKEAYFALALLRFESNKSEDAVANMQKVLQLDPNNPGALEQLNEWGKQGIATESAKP